MEGVDLCITNIGGQTLQLSLCSVQFRSTPRRAKVVSKDKATEHNFCGCIRERRLLSNEGRGTTQVSVSYLLSYRLILSQSISFGRTVDITGTDEILSFPAFLSPSLFAT
jgi:hypothetical protein